MVANRWIISVDVIWTWHSAADSRHISWHQQRRRHVWTRNAVAEQTPAVLSKQFLYVLQGPWCHWRSSSASWHHVPLQAPAATGTEPCVRVACEHLSVHAGSATLRPSCRGGYPVRFARLPHHALPGKLTVTFTHVCTRNGRVQWKPCY